MNILQRIRLAWNLSKRSTQSLDRYNAYLIGSNESDEPVTSTRGSKITTVFNCLNVLAQDVATLPFNVKQDTKNGKETVRGNLQRVIHEQPNPWMTAWQFWYMMVFLGEGRGNSYAWIKREGSKVELWPLDPSRVQVIYDAETGAYFYDVNGRIFNTWEIFHYRSLTTNGVEGLSKIIWNATHMGLQIKQRKFKSTSISNRPPGFIKFVTGNKDQRDSSQESWENDLRNGKTPVLFGDVDYKQLMITPEAADIVESEKWTDTQTLGIWRMAPIMVSNHEKSTYSNTEQQGIGHVKFTLMPILKNIEQECNTKLIPERSRGGSSPLYTKFNVKGLMRGDTNSQIEYFRAMVSLGILNANEVRLLEDITLQEGNQGDKYIVQGAFIDKNDLGEKDISDEERQFLRMVEKFNIKKLNGQEQ